MVQARRDRFRDEPARVAELRRQLRGLVEQGTGIEHIEDRGVGGSEHLAVALGERRDGTAQLAGTRSVEPLEQPPVGGERQRYRLVRDISRKGTEE